MHPISLGHSTAHRIGARQAACARCCTVVVRCSSYWAAGAAGRRLAGQHLLLHVATRAPHGQQQSRRALHAPELTPYVHVLPAPPPPPQWLEWCQGVVTCRTRGLLQGLRPNKVLAPGAGSRCQLSRHPWVHHFRQPPAAQYVADLFHSIAAAELPPTALCYGGRDAPSGHATPAAGASTPSSSSAQPGPFTARRKLAELTRYDLFHAHVFEATLLGKPSLRKHWQQVLPDLAPWLSPHGRADTDTDTDKVDCTILVSDDEQGVAADPHGSNSSVQPEQQLERGSSGDCEQLQLALADAAGRLGAAHLPLQQLRHLGLLFHAAEYPAFHEDHFPVNLGYCQEGSNLGWDVTRMDLRNMLWYQGRLAVLDVGRHSPLHAMLLHEGSQLLRTVYEEDLGTSLADLLYLDPPQAALGARPVQHQPKQRELGQLRRQAAGPASRRQRVLQPAAAGRHRHVYVSW